MWMVETEYKAYSETLKIVLDRLFIFICIWSSEKRQNEPKKYFMHVQGRAGIYSRLALKSPGTEFVCNFKSVQLGLWTPFEPKKKLALGDLSANRKYTPPLVAGTWIGIFVSLSNLCKIFILINLDWPKINLYSSRCEVASSVTVLIYFICKARVQTVYDALEEYGKTKTIFTEKQKRTLAMNFDGTSAGPSVMRYLCIWQLNFLYLKSL